MKEPPQIEKHPDVDNVVCALQQCLIDSFELFEQQLKCGGDLSGFINTPPFSPKDAVGNRTHIEHYHLRPCKPVCYLVGLVRFSDTIYILDVFKHPQQGAFASSAIEERLYSRLSHMCPALTEYKLPATHRSVLPVADQDLYKRRPVKNSLSITPVRGSDSDYLPLGHFANLPGEQSSVALLAGSFSVASTDLPDPVRVCFECDDHPPRRDNLTLYQTVWVCRSGIFRMETEQTISVFCSLHHVVLTLGTSGLQDYLVLEEQAYQKLVEGLRPRFPPFEGNQEGLGKLVDGLTRRFPLSRDE